MVALAAPALAANYSEYAQARVENGATRDRLMQNLYRLILDPAHVSDNGRSFGYITANSTVTQTYSTLLLNEIVYRMQGPESQANITAAFSYLGLNGSNLSCGNATIGNCNTLQGSQGHSRVQNETRRFYESNWDGRTFEIARNRTALWSLQMQWWVQSKIGLVKVLDNARDAVA